MTPGGHLARVVVVGSVNVDLAVQVPRLPRPGETVTGGTLQTGPGGKGGNAAVAARRLGAETWLVGAVGDDEHGRLIREHLESEGVEVGLLRTDAQPTGVAVVLVDGRGENSIAVASGANGSLDPEAVERDLAALPAAERTVVLSNLEVPVDAATSAARVARRRGWTFLLDPAPAAPLPAELVALCSAMTPNEAELVALGGVGSLLAAGAGAVVVTRGSSGAELHRSGAEPVHVPAVQVEAVDTTGAGDAFAAGLTVALAEGRSLEEALRLAVFAGAAATRAHGAQVAMPARSDVDRLRAVLSSP